MSAKLFVGSLPYSTDDDKLKEVFSEVGEVISAKVIIDRDNGRSRGFGFVEMSEEDAKAAIEKLDGSKIDDRAIVVKEAKPREERPRGSYGR